MTDPHCVELKHMRNFKDTKEKSTQFLYVFIILLIPCRSLTLLLSYNIIAQNADDTGLIECFFICLLKDLIKWE